MFDKIQHIGYLTSDLDAAVAWFERSFGATNAGGSHLSKSYPVPSGGRNAYLRFGGAEAEIIEPKDSEGLSKNILTMHHVGYLVTDIEQVAATLGGKGFKFATDAPFTNVMGHKVRYFDSSTTNGVLVHLTQLLKPENPGQLSNSDRVNGLEIEKIVHAGYLVRNLDEAISWYVEKFDGQHVGGSASRFGGRNAFVNFGQVQVELIEPGDLGRIAGSGHTMDHVGYVVGDVHGCMGRCVTRGFKFVEGAPNTNSIKQQVAFFDTSTTMDSRMHLTQLPG